MRVHRVSVAMKRRIIAYYKEFFLRDKAVKHATLMDVVPDPFINETKTEIFWNAMKKVGFFVYLKYTHIYVYIKNLV